MIQFHQFGGAWGVSSASPFCVKLEACLRYWKIPYVTHNEKGMGKAPKGKVPFVEYKGELIGDSGLIADRLVAEGLIPADEFDERTRSEHLAMQRLVEEHLYWAMVWFRWVDETNFKILCDGLFREMPGPLRALLPKVFRKSVIKNLKAHGLGRHRRDEIATMAIENIKALSSYLGEREYFCGSAPHLLDMSVFGLLINVLKTPMDSPLRDALESHANLVRYCHRMEKMLFVKEASKAA